jgi:hypothetical protein
MAVSLFLIRLKSGINEHQDSLYINKHKIMLDFNQVPSFELWLD